MKKIILIAFSAIFMISCKKDIEFDTSQSTYTSKVRAGLKDSLTARDFAHIDFTRSIITKTDTAIFFLRIPFINKKLSEEFVLLQTDTLGKILTGSIIKLSQRTNISDEDYGYNGTVELSYLNGTTNIISEIKNGYITAFHKRQVAQRSLVVPDTRIYYPEVIGAYYNILTGGATPSYYVSLSGFTPGGAVSGWSTRYSPMEGTGRGNENNTEEDDPLVVDFEYIENLSPIDIAKYLKCFSSIPDGGSTCSIEILVDIPIDGFPNRIFDVELGSPGHTFLRIAKTNGSQSITQNIGFYPNSTWKMLFASPVENKIVDNGEHEFNASLKMNLTPEQLNNTINLISSLSGRDYDIDDYNCTDFSLQVFNQSRPGNPIDIPKIELPGVRSPISTPGELYKKLKSMQQSGIEGSNISSPGTKTYVSKSNGPCD